MILLIITGLAVIGLFATGALLSQEKPSVTKPLLLIHNITDVIGTIGITIFIYMFINQK